MRSPTMFFGALMALLFATLVALAPACNAPGPNATPEEIEAHNAKQAARAEIYLEFAEENADKFVDAGKWERAKVDDTIGLLRESLNLWAAFKAMEDAPPDKRVEAELAFERAILSAISLGIDRALE